MAFKASKYKHVVGKVQKRELWYPDLRPNQNAGDWATIKASARLVGINWASAAGAVAVLPLEQTGKRKAADPFLVHAHSGQLADFAFSPFDDYSLATAGSDDAAVKLWALPPQGLTDNISVPVATFAGHRKCVGCLAFHPVASNVLATGSDDRTLRVWDLNREAAAALVIDPVGDGGVQSLAWNYEGSSLVAISKDKIIRVLDPRAGKSAALEGEGHQGQKPARVVWLGNSPRICTTGFSKTRERQLGVWDTRQLSNSLKMVTLDSSTGVMTPLFDVDTNMLFLCGTGDSMVRAYEIVDDKNIVSELTVVAADTPQKGVAWVPKRSLDVMDLEVARLLRLTKDAICPISYNVPRKSKSKFADDLFPPTSSPVPALNAEEWFSGACKPPNLISLNPEDRAVISTSTSLPVGSAPLSPDKNSNREASASSSSSSSSSSTQASEPLDQPEQPDLSGITRTGVIPKIVRSSKFRHIQAKPMLKSRWYDNVKVHGAVSNTIIRGNSQYFAVPWAGVGGLLAVVPTALVGKLPNSVPCFETGSQLADFDLHPFDESLVATGSEDGHIKLWKIPPGGLIQPGNKNITSPLADLIGHSRKITTLGFHPSVSDLLLTSSADLTVRFWDVSAGKEVLSVQGHGDFITSLAVNYQGDLVVSASRDKQLRIVDPRSSAIVATAMSHAGAKAFKATWLCPKNLIFTAGFGKSSERECQLWDQRNFSSPYHTQILDQLAGVMTPYYDEDIGVMYLVGRGDGVIKMFEIGDEPPYMHFLTEYSSGVPQMGAAPLPKHSLSVEQCEIARFLRVTDNCVEPVQMFVPRTRMEYFNEDLYPETRSNTATLSAEQWLAGETKPPTLMSVQPSGMVPLSQAPVIQRKTAQPTTSSYVDHTPSKEQVFSKFYQQTLNFKEETSGGAAPASEEEDDEWK